MKKVYLLAIATAAVLVGCSSNDVVNDIPGSKMSREVPIGFNVQKQNITRADTKLEDINHYNFGVFAYKINGESDSKKELDQLVMDNYLVGYSNGSNKGYDKKNATTWASEPGSTDNHVSPWFYEGLGKKEYSYSGTGFYQYNPNEPDKGDVDYMSKNDNQYLRYWDLSYTNTIFYCYAPYNKNVTFNKTKNEMTFPATAIRDGYEEPLNSDYEKIDRSLGEYMYAGVQAKNADLNDVTVSFKHMGAQLFIRFYEAIPGYKVEIIDLCADNGKTSKTGDIIKGIQATPAIVGSPNYSDGTYYTTSGATISFAEATAAATYAPSWAGSTTATNTTPLMFKIPTAGCSTATDAPANLTPIEMQKGGEVKHQTIKEKVSSGTQEYSYSPTIYYPVAQPKSEDEKYTSTGFTFHISYRIIADDNKEYITVHNATVFVPAKQGDNYITAWQPDTKYTYTFKFTKNTVGSTNFGDNIDPTSPTPSSAKALYPIVFDGCTITDFTDGGGAEYIVTEKE